MTDAARPQGHHPSLLAMIGWRMVAVSLLFLAVLIATLQTRLESTVDTLRHQALEAEARDLVRRLAVEPGGAVSLLPEPEGAPAPLAQAFRVTDARGTTLLTGGSLPAPFPSPERAQPMPEDTVSLSDIARFTLRLTDRPGEIRGVTLDAVVGGRLLYVQVGADETRRDYLIDDLVGEFFVKVSWLLIPALAFLMLVNLLTVWVELRPMIWASELLAHVGPKETALRVPEEALPREFLPLFQAVNQALDRLDRGFKLQREFTADAAHELRTPLAVLSAHIDTLADKQVAAALREDVAAMSRLVAQLLRIAQLENLTIEENERADLQAVALDVAAMLAPLAVAEGKSIELAERTNPVIVRGNTEALGQALRNLVENALRHTPAGKAVEIAVSDEPSIRVRDHGSGVPLEQRELLFQRFWRAKRSGGGAGLGLAIVARIAEAHGGAVEVSDAPGGGALFTLTLPKLKHVGAGLRPAPTS